MALRLVVVGLFLAFAAIAGVFLYAALGDPEHLAQTPGGTVLVAEERLGPWRMRAELGDEREIRLTLAPATVEAADPRRPPPTLILDMPDHGMAPESVRLAARTDMFVATTRLPMPGAWRLMLDGADDTVVIRIP